MDDLRFYILFNSTSVISVFIPNDCLLIYVAFVVLCCVGCLWVTGVLLISQDRRMCDLQFYVLATVFQSYQDDGQVIMNGCV